MAPPPRLRVAISIGRHRSAGPMNQAKLETIIEAIKEEAVDAVKVSSTARLGPLAKRLEETVATEYREAIRYATVNLMGLSSRGTAATNDQGLPIYINPPGKDGQIGLGPKGKFVTGVAKQMKGAIVWKALQKKTVLEKMRRNGGNITRANRFFVDRGSLRTSLQRQARSIVKRTGVVNVTYKDAPYRVGGRFADIRNSTEVVPLGSIKITLLPKIPQGLLPGLASGNISDHDPNLGFEQALGLSATNLRKLAGHPHAHRPLLQPVFTYWTLFRIPGRIAAALNNAMRK